MKKADIGLIGLAAMGENLVLNMESKGFTVAVFNRTTEKVKNFVEGRGAGKNIIGAYSLEERVQNVLTTATLSSTAVTPTSRTPHAAPRT